jgi:hypothetical protein
MITFLKKHISLISALIFLATLWLFPAVIRPVFVTVLAINIASAFTAIFKSHRMAYLQGKITVGNFVRKVAFGILGILLAMTLAGLLGRIIAQVATEQISNDFTELIAGVVIGLLAGMGMGVLVKRTWGKFVRS